MANKPNQSTDSAVPQFDPKHIADSDHVSISETALTHLRNEIANRGNGIGVRLSFKASGCSGYRYVIDIVDAEQPGDVTFVIADDFCIFVAADCFNDIRGSRIDYVSKGLNKVIEIANPNVTSECGCGESFTTK